MMNVGTKVGLAIVGSVLVSASIAGLTQDPVAGKDAKDPWLSREVTVDFQAAPAKEVFEWLGQNHYSFVAKEGTFDGRLTVKIHGKPLSDAAEAIAKAMGGHWERSGDIFTLVPGPKTAPWDFAIPSTLVPFSDKDTNPLLFKEFKLLPKDFTQMSPEMLKELKDMKVVMPDMKALKDMKVYMPDSKQMKDMLDLELKMSKDFAKIAPDPKRMKELEVRAQDLAKAYAGDAKAFSFKSQNIGDLMASITKAQWELQAKQGYLKSSDLTAAQRKMLGSETVKGDWTITFSVDGKTLTIKGGK